MTKTWLLKELDGFLAEANLRFRNAQRRHDWDDQVANVARAQFANDVLQHFTQMPETNPAPDHALTIETRDPECPAKTQD